jgi:hypothetical protein
LDAATFARLKAPGEADLRVAGAMPYGPALENHVMPDRNRIMTGIRDVLQVQRAAVAA